MVTYISRFFKKIFPARNHKVVVTKVLFVVLLIVTVASFSIPAFSLGGNQSDPQEATIKKVLEKTAEAFGWGPDYYFAEKHSDGSTKNLYPKILGPKNYGGYINDEWVDYLSLMYEYEVTIQDSSCGICQKPFNILAFSTEELAKNLMDRTSEKIIPKQQGQVPSWDYERPWQKVIDFHGGKAIYTFRGKLQYDAFQFSFGRFVFTTSIFEGKKITVQELAEELYQNSIKYGLITDSEGNNPDIIEDEVVVEEAPVLKVSSKPTFFSAIGDSAKITVTLKGTETNSTVGEKVVLLDADSNAKIAEGSLGENGTIPFDVKHTNPDTKEYHYLIKAMGLSKGLTIPVVEMGIQFEINPATGESFEGIVADGKSILEIQINLDESLSGGILKLSTKPSIGEVEGTSFLGKVELDSGKAVLQYIAPSYIKHNTLPSFNEDTSSWFVPVPIVFTYTAEDGTKKEFNVDLRVYRTPVMLVHGFTGDKTTWSILLCW